ncbi:MAG: Hsp20/alpha crystallin family protein [Candidatus Ratteibacteria bacterium]|nr:Hsp20/alpha crystallin family protein [Candidatus Ratteibacteria bacterium]
MKLVPWVPREQMADLHKDLNHLFDNFFTVKLPQRFSMHFSPSIEVSEDKKSYTVKAEIPGVSSKDIEVSFKNNVLTVSGEKKQEKEEKKKNTHYKEIQYGSFFRSIPLEMEVDKAHIKSKRDNGTLTLTLPKKNPSRGKTVKIKVQ